MQRPWGRRKTVLFEKLEGGVAPVVKWLSPKVRWTVMPEQARDHVGLGKESEYNSR